MLRIRNFDVPLQPRSREGVHKVLRNNKFENFANKICRLKILNYLCNPVRRNGDAVSRKAGFFSAKFKIDL